MFVFLASDRQDHGGPSEQGCEAEGGDNDRLCRLLLVDVSASGRAPGGVALSNDLRR